MILLNKFIVSKIVNIEYSNGLKFFTNKRSLFVNAGYVILRNGLRTSLEIDRLSSQYEYNIEFNKLEIRINSGMNMRLKYSVENDGGWYKVLVRTAFNQPSANVWPKELTNFILRYRTEYNIQHTR